MQGSLETTRKVFVRRPAQVALNLRDVDHVPVVMFRLDVKVIMPLYRNALATSWGDL